MESKEMGKTEAKSSDVGGAVKYLGTISTIDDLRSFNNIVVA